MHAPVLITRNIILPMEKNKIRLVPNKETCENKSEDCSVRQYESKVDLRTYTRTFIENCW
jgi:hypothetical protein